MDISRLAPELREPFRRMPTIPFDRAWVRLVVRVLLAAFAREARIDGVRVEKRSDVGHGVRVYYPDVRHSPAALVWIHGGGYIIGASVQDHRLCADTARDLGIVVVSVDYRTSPKHPFPAALDDSLEAWRWVSRNAGQLGIERSRVALGGVSAGGGLAASLAQYLRDTDETSPAAQWLFSPMLDDRTAARRDLDALEHFVWTNRLNRFGWQSYLGIEPGSADVPPYAVPTRRDDLRGLPPAWIGVGDIDLFCDEDTAYAERLRAAGVSATLEVVAGAPHGFESLVPDAAVSREHVQHAREWLRRAVERNMHA